MILISHRGNISGSNPELENQPDYITSAYRSGFDVEIDVWLYNGMFYLGHDEPQYLTDWHFLTTNGFWCHAKNFQALVALRSCGANCFWHQDDDYTLTSSGYIWTYPGKSFSPQSIVVCQSEKETKVLYRENLYGICSDYVGVIK